VAEATEWYIFATTKKIIYRLKLSRIINSSTQSISTNNIGRDPDKDIARGIQTVVQKLEQKMPNAKIILLGVLPRQGVSQDTSVEHINTAIAKLNDDKVVHYLDLGSHFRASLGNVKSNLYRSDQLHINKDGYALWHELMEKLFNKL
jgi:beta-glucosidase